MIDAMLFLIALNFLLALSSSVINIVPKKYQKNAIAPIIPISAAQCRKILCAWNISTFAPLR